jgi:membrane protein implicated in regulation of membrane protease activity
MSNANIWWMVTGAAVAVELLTGTFYLLMIALGLAAAALAAHAGASTTAQILVAAIVGAAAVTALHLLRGKQPTTERASANKDVNLDIGETVEVRHWQHGHTATVKYRGAEWAATLADGAEPRVGPCRIVEVVGNRLVLLPA